MAGLYNQFEDRSGFKLPVIISAAVHAAVFLAAIFLFPYADYSRKFIAPVYTVDLIGFAPGNGARQKPRQPEPAEVKQEEAKTPSVTEAKDITVKKNGAQNHVLKKKTAAPTKEKRKESSIDEALKGAISDIARKVREKEREATIDTGIEQIENRLLEKRRAEIREKVAHKDGIVKSQRSAAPAGQASGGVARKEEGLEARYVQLVADIIHSKWNYAGEINPGDVVILAVRIDKSGALIENRVEQLSANEKLVQSAVRAIEKAAPFPPVPAEFGGDSIEFGVCFPRCER